MCGTYCTTAFYCSRLLLYCAPTTVALVTQGPLVPQAGLVAPVVLVQSVQLLVDRLSTLR